MWKENVPFSSINKAKVWNAIEGTHLLLLSLRQQQADDRAEADKQQMIKKMMTTLKKEKGLVDVSLAMNYMMIIQKCGDQTLEEWNLENRISQQTNYKIFEFPRVPRGRFIVPVSG